MLHHRDRVKSALTVTLALMVCTASPAMAVTIPPSGPVHVSQPSTGTNTSTNLCSEVCSGRGFGSSSASAGATLPHDPRSRAVATSRHIHGAALPPARDAGFDFGDAAIGAGAAVILLVVAGGATASRRGRRISATRASVAS